MVIYIKSIFPTNKNEQDLVKFIGRYQYLSIKDVSYFFHDTYYPKRITRLVKNGILRRYNKNLVLAEDGYNFMKILEQPTVPLRYQKKYVDRLKFMSHLAALYYQDKTIHIEIDKTHKVKTNLNDKQYTRIINIVIIILSIIFVLFIIRTLIKVNKSNK